MSACGTKRTCKPRLMSGSRPDVRACPPPGFSSGLVVVQGPHFGHRIRRSNVDAPSHPSTDHSSDKPSADSKRLSSRSIKLPAFTGLSLDELRREWRRLYHSEPPRISRDLLMRGIGYRRQEIQHGGLGKATRRKLKTRTKMFRTTGRVAPDPGLSLKPGARLVREWHGHTHTVNKTIVERTGLQPRPERHCR
jgi:hypothetical protein